MKYGNPNGSQAAQAMGLAIPTWLLDDEWRPMLVASGLCLSAGLFLWFYALQNNIRYNCANGISVASKENMTQMLVGILEDNDGNQRAKGLNADDWIDVYEQSTEAMALNDLWQKKDTFKDVVNGMKVELVKGKKIKTSEAGDGCCGGDDSP